MAFKRLFVDIQGDISDVWNIVDIQKEEEYNTHRGEFDYKLVVLKNSVNKEIEKKVYRFTDEDERDTVLADIKAMMMKNPNFFFLGENDGAINDDELENMGAKKKIQINDKRKRNFDQDEENE